MRVHGQQRHAQRFAAAIQVSLPAGPARHGRRRLALGLAPRRIGIAAVGHDLAVADLDDALGMAGHVHVVRDQDDGVAGGIQLFQDAQHFLAGVRVQRAGRLVGQDDLAAVHQRPRDADALLLAARQLAGAVIGTVAQAQAPEQFAGALVARAPLAGVDRRHFHVARRAQVRQQVVALEDEAEVLAAQFGQLVGVEFAGAAPAHAVVAAGGAVQAAQDIHQRGLARAGRANDGHHLAGLDGQVDVLEHRDGLLTRRELPAHARQGNQGTAHDQWPAAAGSAAATESTVTTRSPGCSPSSTSARTLLFMPMRTWRSSVLLSLPTTRTA